MPEDSRDAGGRRAQAGMILDREAMTRSTQEQATGDETMDAHARV